VKSLSPWKHAPTFPAVNLAITLTITGTDTVILYSPPARGFFSRVSTRVLTQPTFDRWKTVKMPESDYVRYFRYDAQGHYVGTDPEREWSEEEIMEKYRQYQDLPLRSIFGRTTEDHVPFPLAWGT
jgi:hypothetical protein